MWYNKDSDEIANYDRECAKQIMVKIAEKMIEKGLLLLPTMSVPLKTVSDGQEVPDALSDVEIIVHAMTIGMGVLGHVDVCIDGWVYSYGNYDELACSMKGARGEGVVLCAPREAYLKFCKRHYQKTLFLYSLEVTDEQKQDLKRRLRRLLEHTKSWEPTDEICSLNPVSGQLEEMYAYFMLQEMPVTFYKFEKTRFEEYTIWRRNCLLFVDRLMACLREPQLRARLTTFPSLYQEKLEELRINQPSIVVGCVIY